MPKRDKMSIVRASSERGLSWALLGQAVQAGRGLLPPAFEKILLNHMCDPGRTKMGL